MPRSLARDLLFSAHALRSLCSRIIRVVRWVIRIIGFGRDNTPPIYKFFLVTNIVNGLEFPSVSCFRPSLPLNYAGLNFATSTRQVLVSGRLLKDFSHGDEFVIGNC